MVKQGLLGSFFPTEQDIPAAFQLAIPTDQREYLIGGDLVEWQGDLQPVLSPVCISRNGHLEQVVIGSTPLMDSATALSALDAAVDAYDAGHGAWPAMSVADRIDHVEAFLAKMREQRQEVVNLLMWEIGKSLKDSEKEFDRTCDYILETVAALKDLDRRSSRFEIEQGTLGQIRRVPFGVTLCMGPYNYPLNETFSTLIPALIMGNTVVFKPAKYGVLLIRPLLSAFQESFPSGVINVIYGRGRETVGALMESGKIDVFAFIGTNKGASDLKKLHPKPHRLRAILGLDAKNPGIILKDANLDDTVSECVSGTLSFNGQRCTALKLLLVHRRIADRFIELFSQRVSALKPGMPWDGGVGLTPLPEPGKTDYLKQLVQDAQTHGARIVNEYGGETRETFFYPAILYPVNEAMRVYREEQFGPVVPIVPYDDLEAVIEYVISSNFGQQLSIFGENSEEVARLIDALSNQVGRINLNAQCQRGPDTFPFTGRKDSAEGTLSVADALRQFSIRTLVAAKNDSRSKHLISDIIRNRRSSFLTTDFIF